MKKFAYLLLAMFVVCGEVSANPRMKAPAKKAAFTVRVDQVLRDGILVISGQSVFLLKGHPDQNKLADGDAINCYALRTEEVYRYQAVNGAQKSARIYKYFGKRLGR